jgi:hypothetical protein
METKLKVRAFDAEGYLVEPSEVVQPLDWALML